MENYKKEKALDKIMFLNAELINKMFKKKAIKNNNEKKLIYMRDGKHLVSTVMEKVKTFIPSRKSTNRVGKTQWNKDLTVFPTCVLYVFLYFVIFCYALL